MTPLFADSYSQASQESFVLTVLNEKRNGLYVELGGGWPIHNSNTYLLEKRYGWSGVSFENDPDRAKEYNLIRKNKTLECDAKIFNYKKYFIDNNYPKQIDYLQMDIHPATDTLIALKSMPLKEYRFSVITYEHNGYQHKETKKESREIFLNLGYKLIVGDVIFDSRAYEDWWIDPLVVAEKNYIDLYNNNIDHKAIFNK
jgi:hypothetical protein